MKTIVKALDWAVREARSNLGEHTGGPNERDFEKKIREADEALNKLKGLIGTPKKEIVSTGLYFPESTIGDNAFAVLGKACRIIDESNLKDKDKIKNEFLTEAKSGDYDHLCNTVRKYFEVE